MAFAKSNDFDLIGKRINDIEVLSIAGYKGNPPRTYYKVKCCRCGKIFEMRRNKFFDKKHPPMACYECIKNKYDNKDYINEIIGKKINMLTCEKFVGFREVPDWGRNKPRRQAMYLCRCECGGTTTIDRKLFLSGQVKSCGCQNTVGLVKHDESRTRLYHIWQGIKYRCNDLSNPNYGGKGITVCPEWIGKDTYDGYMSFRNWALSNGYRDDLSIDRINSDGPYAPWNCRWATTEQQNWNKSITDYTEYCGKSVTALDLCKNLNLSIDTKTLSRRLANEGNNYTDWSMNDKLFVPAGIQRETYRALHNITNPFTFEDKNK